MSYKVYKYIFPNGKIYIGTTKNTIAKRREQGYQHNQALKDACRKYGWSNVETIILADGLTQDEAFKKEKEFILKYHATSGDVGFNVSPGGKATFKGLKHTAEHRQHMSELYQGKVFSSETLRKMKEAHKKEQKAVIATSESGEKTEFESLHEAAKKVGGRPTNVSRAANNNTQYKGFKWAFAEGGD